MTNWNLLPWDSDFFGFTVARIEAPQPDELAKTVTAMATYGVVLAYWSVDPEDVAANAAAASAGAFLADRKVTYAINADDMRRRHDSLLSVGIEEYASAEPAPELVQLALGAGIYSRFLVDPRMPSTVFPKLYTIWIRSSVNKTIADAVYVARDAGRIVGMVTVGEKLGRGDIGLLAVDPATRGRNLGLALVARAQEWALDRGYAVAQVVTQGANAGACRFYEKCGYRIDRVENIYHFWMDQR